MNQERTATTVCKSMRRFLIPLVICAVLVGFSFAQDSTSALGALGISSSSQNGTGGPSDADCVAATASGGTPPAGCGSGDGSYSGGRQSLDSPQIRTPELMSGPETPEQTVAPQNPSDIGRLKDAPPKRTEFEQLVSDTTGHMLPIFGQSLFTQPSSTFAVTDRAQVPDDYVIGPDDELQIRIWGQVNANLRVKVDRSGNIFIPHIGEIAVAGIHYSDLDQQLRNQILKVFHNFNLTVNIGRIRSIQVFVVGNARYPGTYTVSSLCTLVNAIFASGGPTPQGSLRDVQVQRDGQTIEHLDFYDFLIKGDKSKDVHLQSGDVLFFPPVGSLIAIAGSVNTPAIYEMKKDSSLSDLIETAGGLDAVADSSKITVERIGDNHARSVLEFPLDAESSAMPLKDGDIVRVLSIVPRFDNAVTLRGNVANPGRYPWKPGMRVRDLIPNAQALLTRPYWMNRADMVDGRSTEYPVKPALNAWPTQALSSDARGTASEFDGSDVSPAELSNAALASKTGQAKKPTTVATLSTARKKVTSETLTDDLHKTSPEINWSYAVVQRIDPINLSIKLLSFDLGKAVLEGDPASNLELKDGDIITIFSQKDVSVPQSMRARYVRLEGEVVRAGIYKVQEGETLRDVIKRAGGITPNAYIYGTQMTRESARVEQQKSLDELSNTLEAMSLQAQAAGAPAVPGLIDQLKHTKPSGRIVLALNPNANSIDAYPAITVEDNDRIVIPSRPSTVSVVGAVYNSGSFVFDPKRKVGDYLKMAGKGKPNADMHHAFVLRADGTVVPRSSVNGAFAGDKFASLHLYPGDQIVVPNKIPTGAFVRGLRDWSQIASQFAIMGAELAIIQ